MYASLTDVYSSKLSISGFKLTYNTETNKKKKLEILGTQKILNRIQVSQYEDGTTEG